MGFIDDVYAKAKAARKRVAVPECANPTMMNAAVKAAKDGLAEVVFVCDAAECRKVAAEAGIDVADASIVDVNDEQLRGELAERYASLPVKFLGRKSLERLIATPLYLALVMEAVGEVDCTFGGLDTTTADFVMAAQSILGFAPGVNAPSGMLILESDGREGSRAGLFGLADGAINTEPDVDVLAGIAVASCDTYTTLTGAEARCAFLSYSTDGSGNSPSAQHMREATAKARELRPDLAIDGEFQADAAIDPRVGAKKVKRESAVAGKANVLIFPDAASCNIAAKLVQQFAPGCRTYGPVYQGFGKAVLDCSRGDTEARIYDNIAFCSVMAAGCDR